MTDDNDLPNGLPPHLFAMIELAAEARAQIEKSGPDNPSPEAITAFVKFLTGQMALSAEGLGASPSLLVSAAPAVALEIVGMHARDEAKRRALVKSRDFTIKLYDAAIAGIDEKIRENAQK